MAKQNTLTIIKGAAIPQSATVPLLDPTDTTTSPADGSGSNKQATVPEWAIALTGTGWLTEGSATWVYATALAMAVASDVTARVPVGTKMSYFNNGGTGYGFVSAVTNFGITFTGVTSVTSTDVFTKVAHGLTTLSPVYASGGLASTGLSLNTPYWPVTVTTDTFKLALTPGGSAIDITGTNDSALVLVSASFITLGTGSTALVSGAITVPRYSYAAIPQGFTTALAVASLGGALANPLASDTLWSAKGDLAVATANDVAAVLGVGSFGSTLKADTNETTGLVYGYAEDLRSKYLKPLNSYETYPRAVGCANIAPLSTGVVSLFAIVLPKNFVVTNVTIISGTTPAGTPTHYWVSLCNNSFVSLRSSADQTTTAWGASTTKTIALATPFTTTYEGVHYIALMVTATTPPSLNGQTLSAGSGTTPRIALTGITGQTTAPADGTNLATVPATLTLFAWAFVT